MANKQAYIEKKKKKKETCLIHFLLFYVLDPVSGNRVDCVDRSI